MSPEETNPGAGEGGWAPHVVAAAAILVYANTLLNGFAYDDFFIIVSNQTVHELTGQLRIWLTPYWPGVDALPRGLYRPLTTFLFALQWAVGGGAPLPFHLVNLFLHAGVSVMVFLLVRELTGWKGALAGALLFAVHPVHVEAVANGVGQAELSAALFVLLAALFYVRRPRGAAPGRQVLLITPPLFLAAILAKENAVVLPLLLLALDVAQGRTREPGFVASTAKVMLLLLSCAAFYLTLRLLVLQGSLSGDAAFDHPFLKAPTTRILTALSVWPHYLRLLVFPVDLSATYDPKTLLPAEVVTPLVGGGSILLAILIALTGLRRAWPWAGLGSTWFLLTILPVSNLLVPIGTLLAERTLYLPSVAFALWVGFVGAWALRRVRNTRIPTSVLAGVLWIAVFGFGTRTLLRNPAWMDDGVLARITLRDHPESWRAHWLYALQLEREGEPARSRPHWERAFEIYPINSTFLTSYARFLMWQGDYDTADQVASTALDLRPEAPEALFMKGLIDIALGRRREAARLAETLEALGFAGLGEQLQDSLEDVEAPGGP